MNEIIYRKLINNELLEGIPERHLQFYLSLFFSFNLLMKREGISFEQIYSILPEQIEVPK